MRRKWLSIFLACLAACAFTACGGGSAGTNEGGNGSNPPSPPSAPAPTFQMSVQSSPVVIQQAGESQSVSLAANGSFSGTVEVSLQGVPSGVTVTPPGPFSLTARQLQYVSFSASATTPTGTSTITVTGTSGSVTETASLTLTVNGPAPFQINLSTNSVSLAPGAEAAVQVSVTGPSGTSLMTSLSNLPVNSGLIIYPPEQLLTPATPVSFTVQADALAEPLAGFPLTVTASSGDQSNIATLLLSVNVPYSQSVAPTRSFFVRTDEDVTGAVYDPVRKLVFATVEYLDEVVVYSSVDGTLKATIPADRPQGIDESADGTKVYVGSWGAQIAVIDPDALQVVQLVPGPTPPSTADTTYFSPYYLVAMSNGKVLILETVDGIVEDHLYLWDPSSGTTTLEDVPTVFPGLPIRSLDHTKAMAGTICYDATTDTFSLAPISGAALSPDGSQIAALDSSGAIVIDDAQFNQLARIAVAGISPGQAQLRYSVDGRFLYAATNFYSNNVVVVINAQTFAIVGLAPDFMLAYPNPTPPFAIDETGMIFGGPPGGRGLAFLDVSSPGALRSPVFNLAYPSVMNPSGLPLSASEQTVVTGAYFDANSKYQVNFDAPPASPATHTGTNISVQPTNTITVTAPPGTSPGAHSVTVTRDDGWYQIAPDGVTYGPQILYLEANAGPTQGGTSVVLWGYGFESANMQVTIGGRVAQLTTIPGASDGSPFPFPMTPLGLITPVGPPGLADVTVTTPTGSATLHNGFQYLANAQVFPLVGALQQVVYDRTRQRLYISNADHNRVEVFDLAGNAFLSPIPVGNAPVGLGLSPDGAKLAVANSGDGTVSVINPDSASVVATFAVLTPADLNSACGGAAVSITPIEPERAVVGVICNNVDGGGAVTHILDLNSGSLSCTGVVVCNPDGVSMSLIPLEIVATSDGTKVACSGCGGQLGIWNVSANTVYGTEREMAGSLPTINDDGTLTSASISTLAPQLSFLAVFDPRFFEVGYISEVNYLAAAADGVFNNLPGIRMNSSGSLLYQPQQQVVSSNGATLGVDIFDTHTGRLLTRVALPDPLEPGFGPMAIDETGGKLFLISSTGLTIAQLSQIPLTVATVNPSTGSAGTTVTISGSGFESGATVTFGTASTTPATFVDGNTLQVQVPTIAAGAARVTVTNPDGRTYSFDDAFTAQ
jgi:YVTN family beta-propeller protein